MRFDIMTLFPELVETVLGTSIIGRAQKSGAIEVVAHQIRDYSENKHRHVDDTPYGGGKGMLMAAQPIWNCYQGVLNAAPVREDERRRVIYMSPTGALLTQKRAEELVRDYDRLIILCGHYEGVDHRVLEEIVDEEISVGDYVLTGGEIPACVLVDCVSRLIDGVLSDEECYQKESISSGLLEHPQYTKPAVWHEKEVPAVLLSGDHAKVEAYRLEQSLALTEKRRPDLYRAWMEAHPPAEPKRKRKKKAVPPIETVADTADGEEVHA
ncbi:MAG: tRNA (guanosine(37)-N1)-methyltransferase TrmD [Clostridia bacterium]|nr:tRNA (guanosine(37)-N1)-methyltransferase TrmD [Clostridia bacterium]